MPASKKYQVFVSSTFWDLQDERQAVIQALLDMNCIPVAMEMFPASDDAQWELIKRVIDDCDYYVVIVKNRYGSLAPDGISYTEKEYDYAVDKGIPVLGFLHSDPESVPAKESVKNPKNAKKLKAFREKVEKKTRRDWTTPDGLAGVVSRSLAHEMRVRPRQGWVRATDETKIADLNARIVELEAALEAALKSALEASKPPPLKIADWDPEHMVDFVCVADDVRDSNRIGAGRLLAHMADSLRRGLRAQDVSGILWQFACDELYWETTMAYNGELSPDTRDRVISILLSMGVIMRLNGNSYGGSGEASPFNAEHHVYWFTKEGERAYIHMMAGLQ